MPRLRLLLLSIVALATALFTSLTLLSSASGATTTNGSIVRVSIPAGGGEANGASYLPVLSPDGAHVAFVSSATNLVPTDTNGVADIFAVDLTGHINRASVASDGTQANGSSYEVALSDDGRYAAFSSSASNLVPNDTNGKRDIFVHDQQTGATERVSISSGGLQGDGDAGEAAIALDISGDGRYVAFMSAASNMIPNDTTFDEFDVYLRDRQTNATSLVSVASDGTQANDYSGYPAISADGRFIAFFSYATNLDNRVTSTTGHIYAHDRQTGQTQLASVSTSGTAANGWSTNPIISANGRYVAFESVATNLVSNDTNGQSDIFVRDLQSGVTTRVSVASDGTQANAYSRSPAISGDGRFVVFESNASNLVVDDTNNIQDVFVRDRLTGATTLVSVGMNGSPANGISYNAAIAANGQLIGFASGAYNLVADDTNFQSDIFVTPWAVFEPGSVTGTIWTDLNANRAIDTGESPLSAHPVDLLLAGNLISTTTTDLSGTFAFDDLPVDSRYAIRVVAPISYTPSVVMRDFAIDPAQTITIPIGLLPLGSLIGQVATLDRAGVPSATLQIESLAGAIISATQTDANGLYRFGVLPPDNYVLHLITPNGLRSYGLDRRNIAIVGNSNQVINWTVVAVGELRVALTPLSAALPISNVSVIISGTGGLNAVYDGATNASGVYTRSDLIAGVYAVRVSTATLPVNVIVQPPEQLVNIAPNSPALADFNIGLSQALHAVCTASGDPFPCMIGVRDLTGMLVLTHSLTLPAIDAWITSLAPGVYDVTLRPDGPARVYWPTYQQLVILYAGEIAQVRYPYNPYLNTLRGRVFNDRNQNGQFDTIPSVLPPDDEANDNVVAGLTVRLTTIDGALITTTTTMAGLFQAGAFSFANMASGDYCAELVLPGDWTPTTLTRECRTLDYQHAPDEIRIGVEPAASDIAGRVYYDRDGNGAFHSFIDQPLAGLTMTLLSNNSVLSTTWTAANGAYQFAAPPAGQYTLRLAPPNSAEFTLSTAFDRDIAVSANVPVRIDYALLRTIGTVRVLAFYDANYNGLPDPDEQRLAGANLDLSDQACGASGSIVSQATSASDGVATFNAFLISRGCATIRSGNTGLPPGLFSLNSTLPRIDVPPVRNTPIALPIAPQRGELIVLPFLDQNGNGLFDAAESVEANTLVSVSGQSSQWTTSQGTSFLLSPGYYTVTIQPRVGLIVGLANPHRWLIFANTQNPLYIPLRIGNVIAGQVVSPYTGRVFGGLSLKLCQPVIFSCIVKATATSDRFGYYQFVFSGESGYYIIQASAPPGYRASTSYFYYMPGQTVYQDVDLYPTDLLLGQVYFDTNDNGGFDSDEHGFNTFSLDPATVTLLNYSGQPTQTALVAADGSFRLSGLQSNVRYGLALNKRADYIVTDSPAWFTTDTVGWPIRIGLLEDNNQYTSISGRVYRVGSYVGANPLLGYGGLEVVPGATVRYVSLACTSPSLSAQSTDLNGHYEYLFGTSIFIDDWLCLQVTDLPPGYREVTPNPRVHLVTGPTSPVMHLSQDIPIEPIPTVSRSSALNSPLNSAHAVQWFAFRDDNFQQRVRRGRATAARCYVNR